MIENDKQFKIIDSFFGDILWDQQVRAFDNGFRKNNQVTKQ